MNRRLAHFLCCNLSAGLSVANVYLRLLTRAQFVQPEDGEASAVTWNPASRAAFGLCPGFRAMERRSSVFELPESSALWRQSLPYVLLLSATFTLYSSVTYFDFVIDDFNYIVENFTIWDLSSRHLRSIWSNPFFGQYAPLHHTLLAAIYSVSGLDPVGYHVVQLLLHGACVCLLYFVLKAVESARIALLACLLFVVFPPNLETVAWVSETKSTLAFLFFLLSFFFFHRFLTSSRWPDAVFCALFLVLSLLSKINTLVAPAIFFLYVWKRRDAWNRRTVGSLAALSLISVAFTILTLHYSAGSIAGAPDRLFDGAILENPAVQLDFSKGYFGGFLVHLLNLPQFLLFYVRMLVFPHPLSFWHMVAIHTELNWAIGLAWIGLLALLWLLYRSPRERQFWMLWFVLFLLPILQLVPNPTWVADRYLYVPAVGAFVLGARLFFKVLDRIRQSWARVGWEAAMGVVLFAFAWQTHLALPAWRSEVSVWEAATKATCAQSAFCHFHWGKALLQEEKVDLGLRQLIEAVRLRPSPPYLIYLGDGFVDGPGDSGQALRAYAAAYEAAGRLPLFVTAKVAKAHYLAGDFQEADRIITAAMKIDPNSTPLLLVDGFLQWKLGNFETARSRLRRLLDLNSLYPRASNPTQFLLYYWKRPAEVGSLMADLAPF